MTTDHQSPPAPQLPIGLSIPTGVIVICFLVLLLVHFTPLLTEKGIIWVITTNPSTITVPKQAMGWKVLNTVAEKSLFCGQMTTSDWNTICVSYLQLKQCHDIEQCNRVLQDMEWLEFAGVTQHVRSLSERDNIVDFACNWLCLGRTRPALERFLFEIYLQLNYC